MRHRFSTTLRPAPWRLLPILATATLIGAGLTSPARAMPSFQPVATVRVDGPITSLTADYIGRALGEAERQGAGAFLIELDTPGGSVDAMLDIGGQLLNAPLPTIVWVGPEGAQAASAGTFIVLAAHAAGMAPHTTIGAASPVGPDGGDLPVTLGRKAMEDLAATARTYSDRRGAKAIAWAEKAVRDAASATAEEALRLGVIDAIAASPAALLGKLDGRSVTVAGKSIAIDAAGADLHAIEANPAERLLDWLAHPAVALLLLTIGVNAILIELSHPGGFVAGILGVLALALGLYSLGVLEANWIGLAFMAAALGLFLVDVKAHSLGALSAAGIGLFVAGGVILFSGGFYAVPWGTIVTLGLGTGLFFAFVVGAAARAMRRPPYTGAEALIGQTAEVRRSLAPRGTVFVAGEWWDAELADAAAAPVAAGSRVHIVERDGYTLRVAPFDEAAVTGGESP